MSDRTPTEAVRRLAERLKEETAKVGLTMRQFALLPNLDGGPDMAQAIFTLDDDGQAFDPEQANIDAEFEAMLLGQRAAERDDEVRKRLEKGMNLGGLLDEDDGDDGLAPA